MVFYHLSYISSILITRLSVTLTEKNMTHLTQLDANIPVDAVIQFQTDSMNSFKSCHALNVSSAGVHILLDQPLPNQATVTLMVRPEGTGQQPYFVSGEVKKRGLQDGGWLHEVAASSNRPWSPMFQYDVLCSAFGVVPELADNPSSDFAREHAWQHLVAGELAQPAPLPTQIAA